VQSVVLLGNTFGGPVLTVKEEVRVTCRRAHHCHHHIRMCIDRVHLTDLYGFIVQIFLVDTQAIDPDCILAQVTARI
jgi:hypothetical protein